VKEGTFAKHADIVEQREHPPRKKNLRQIKQNNRRKPTNSRDKENTQEERASENYLDSTGRGVQPSSCGARLACQRDS
jgi:hypothetical protein